MPRIGDQFRRTRCAWTAACAAIAVIVGCRAPQPGRDPAVGDPLNAAYVQAHYTKREVMIPMRDGVRLFTSIYTPGETSRKHPMLIRRTPYGVRPYGEDQYPAQLGPSALFDRAGYIFVFQDVRGRFKSEGEFVNMRPHVEGKNDARPVDESSDAYDTIEWLLANIDGHNGRAGLYGISYPGFYAAAGMIDAHPALRAVSPQAPIADWFFDDFFHHGAFYLPHTFNFAASFGRPRAGPTTEWGPRFEHGTPDGYQFFLDLGPLRNADERYFHGGNWMWSEIIAHPNYDEFWQARNLLPHLRNVAPAVMTVGGWFDAEDLYGPLAIYRAIEEKNPGIFNVLVMGPWKHGGWSRTEGDRLGDIFFGAPTSAHYQEQIEFAFFEHYLKDAAPHGLPEAYVFQTGANRWRRFDSWPPAGCVPTSLYCCDRGELRPSAPAASGPVFDEFVSDPARPVPHTQAITIGMHPEYMTEDQRFAARRPDVLVYQTPPLSAPITIAGPIDAELWVSTSGSDSDWVVKLIDVFPPDAVDPPGMPETRRMGGYQMMVRSEVIRGRFRDSYETPAPFTPDTPTFMRLPLQDVLHTFNEGHRVMVQIQCTWFPLVDRNPQTYVENIFFAESEQFTPATQRVYRDRERPTRLTFGTIGAY